MHNYYKFGLCFKEKRKNQLNSRAWDECIHKKEFIDMTKIIKGENPNLPLNENAIFKIGTLLEDDDLIRDASNVFNSFIKNDNTDEESKNAFHFMKANNINPFGAKDTVANIASGVGKTMDSNEAFDLYNKAEQGSNTIPNSHALQNFFEKNKTSDNYHMNSLMHGYGKEVDDSQMRNLVSQGFNNKLDQGQEDLVYQKIDASGMPKDFPDLNSTPKEIRKALEDFYDPSREKADGFAGRLLDKSRSTLLNKGFGVGSIAELRDVYQAEHGIPTRAEIDELRAQIHQNNGADEASKITKKELIDEKNRGRDFYRNFDRLIR